MERTSTSSHSFAFHGDGGTLFKHFLVNGLLTIVTLGIYYPWAKAAMERYFYGETEFAGTRFRYHGTGKEMFLGYLKVLFGYLGLLSVVLLVSYASSFIIGGIVLYLTLIGLIPFAIVNSLRYTCSRSSWKGAHFSYEGETGNMATVFFTGLFLTIVTFGIYYPWFLVSFEKEIKNNIWLGEDVTFEFEGKGAEVLKILIKGSLLSIITLGIYGSWMIADLYNYSYNNTSIRQGKHTAYFHSTVTGGEVFKMLALNVLALLFTLGIALPWLRVKNLQYMASELIIGGELDLDAIKANEPGYISATGEALTDVMS